MNKETINYTSAEFWATAPSGAEVLIDHVQFAKWDENGTEWWWSTANHCWDNKIPGASWPLQKYIDNGGFSIIPRPTTFTKFAQESSVGNSDRFVDNQIVGVPEVGEMVEAFDPLNEDWHVVKVLDSQEHTTIAVRDSKDKLWWTYKFRPIKKEPTIQEKILEAWKAQGIDFAYDNEDTAFSYKVLVNFVVNNFDVKEKG